MSGHALRRTYASAAPVEAKPTPVVKIDNLSDPFATVVSVQYGNKANLELLDTVGAVQV